ncbi:type ISP restriction/modification enzyme [Helicobacter vulpis]|uniref:type ISP restriction/modification enzyme n=1 Tax=Helicobacter vulpis TaxID=2316076 RepID=UPI000EB01CB2|nr:type ISP restriction/modification enzyme [Helicobacter vulpis]
MGEASVFVAETRGVTSGCDEWVINPSSQTLENTLQNAHRIYHENLANFDLKSFETKLPPHTKPADAYKFLGTEIDTSGVIGWTRDLKKKFCKKQKLADIDLKYMRTITYRPFTKRHCYFNPEWIEEPRKFATLLPTEKSKNVFLCVNGSTLELSVLMTRTITDVGLIRPCINAYPLYSDGKKESAISLSALFRFQKHYQDENITAEDIFYFVYAILHHVGFKEIYRNFLAKESPRVPLARDFKKMSALGRELAQLHLNYESLEPSQELRIIYKGDLANAPDEHYRVSKMQLEKDTNRLIYNEYLSIDNIPSKAWEYTLCGESVIKLYMKAQRVKESKKAKDANGDLIISDPNDFKGGKYIFETLLRVITLSLKSVDLIEKIGACDYRQEKNR